MNNNLLSIFKLKIFLKPETESNNLKIYIQMETMDF